MNENLIPRVKIKDWTVIYTCWKKRKELFSSRVILDISITPRQASRSEAVDQHIMQCTNFYCAYIWLQFGEVIIVFIV